MPASPRKCCGKNVKFTPTNITANCAFKVKPENKGYHWMNPAMIANTAPVDST
jgi:hypothetical protein